MEDTDDKIAPGSLREGLLVPSLDTQGFQGLEWPQPHSEFLVKKKRRAEKRDAASVLPPPPPPSPGLLPGQCQSLLQFLLLAAGPL
jgi:hypothetical protein